MRPMICLLSLGRRRKRRHGPLMTSGFFSGSIAPFDPFADALPGAGIASLAGVFKSLVDLDTFGVSDNLLAFMSVPGVGGDAKSLYELSVIRGIFHGNRRSDIQQKMMASDQISAG